MFEQRDCCGMEPKFWSNKAWWADLHCKSQSLGVAASSSPTAEMGSTLLCCNRFSMVP